MLGTTTNMADIRGRVWCRLLVREPFPQTLALYKRTTDKKRIMPENIVLAWSRAQMQTPSATVIEFHQMRAD